MSPLVLPAPLWRRLAALVYDGLLYVALLLGGIVLSTPFIAAFVASDAKTPLQNFTILPLYALVIALGFFGWSWTHGGQTLGMRVWRLQLRRLDGVAIRWPIAALRLIVVFALVSGMLALGLYLGAALPRGKARVAQGLLSLPWALMLYYIPCLLSERGRSLGDLAAGTEMVMLPVADKISSPIES